MQKLEDYRNAEGKFHLFLWYPQSGMGNEWLQVSNPSVKTEYAGGVVGYEVQPILITPLNFYYEKCNLDKNKNVVDYIRMN